MPRAAAIVMPASTEEVQAIVKAANKYNFGVKPHGTGWYHWASPMYDEGSRYGDEKDTVQLDMRRMNAIEIDEKNGIAIVEPYVIHAQLHAEAIKRGWTCNIIGAGSSCSVVAAACAYSGIGAGTMWMGGNAENVLGMEWVTPSGEIVRNGSLGSGDGWFCGEGPGPSVRGIMRGTLGSRGGMGVYTKCAIRLAHWPGRTDWPVEGTVPAYRLPLDKTFRAYTVAVPTWEAWTDLYYKIYDNEIGFTLHRQYNLAGADLAPAFWLMYNDPTKQLSDLPAMIEEPGMAELTEEMRISLQIVMAGRSEADIELQDKILDQDPRGSGRLEGREVLHSGDVGVHEPLHEPARPQRDQLRLRRQLHRKLDAGRHARLGQGLHPRGCGRLRARLPERPPGAGGGRLHDGYRRRLPGRGHHGLGAVRLL